MKLRLCALTFLAFACAVGLQASVIVETIGTQHFTDGQKPIGAGTYNTGVAGNPAPFNTINGSDPSGPSFSAAWSYSYSSLAEIVIAATLTIGMYDTDAAAAGNQVAAFLVNGSTDLTTDLNTAFEGHGGANAEYDVYTVTLPSTVFASLHAGNPAFSLDLQGPGLGALGTTTFNGAGIDFSTLTITTQAAVAPSPEPAAWVLCLSALTLVAARHRRSRP